jgi:PIN domain-containing protein
VPRSPDAPLTFFVDRSLGAHDVPDALRAAGVRVEIHDDHFAPDTADIAWLAEVGAHGWVVLTKDSRIRRHPLELQALLAANVAAFMVTATDLTGADMGRLLTTAIPKLTSLARSRARPFIATLSRQGHVTIIQGGERRGGIRRT